MKKKSFYHSLKTVVCFLFLLMFTFALSIPAHAAIPTLSSSRYMKVYPLSTSNNTYIYTSSSLKTRGTSSPYKAYNAVIYATDEIYVYSMNSTYAYVSYPTSSGRKYGYIKTSAITSNNSSKSASTSRATITTYRRAGSTSYGSISKGDSVYGVATSGNYTQVVYPVGNQYKMAWITTSNYNNYVKPLTVTETSVSNGLYIFQSALKTNMVMDVNGAYTSNGTNIQLWEANWGNNQKFQVTKQSSGWYKITDVNSGKAIDVAGGIKGNEVNIQLYSWNGSDAQLWKFYNAGNGCYYIKNKLGYYMDVYSGKTNNGTNIQVYQLNAGTNQKWQLISTTKLTESAVSNGLYIFQSALKSNMVMDVSGAWTSNGTNIHLWESHGDNNQKFQVTKQSSGWYKITDANSGKAIEVAGGVKGNEVNIQLYSWNGSDAQLWKFYNAGNNCYFVKNKLGYYMDVYYRNTANGTNIQVYQLKNDTNQKWKLVSTTKKTNPVVVDNNLITQSEINAAASKYNISTSSNAYNALTLINSKYASQLKNNATGTNVFLFEGVGASSSANSRMNAMCVVVKNKKIVYINKYCSTIPDNPFSPSLNDNTAVPTMVSGVYDFTSTNHQASKSVSSRYIPYAALHIVDRSNNVLRHNSSSSYYYSTSAAINVHGRSGARSNTSKNSLGCLIVGDIFSKYANEYSDFLKAVGVVPSNTTVTKATKCSSWPTGKIVIDRTYAASYLRSVGYTNDAIAKLK